MRLLEKDFLSIQNENEAISKLMQLGEDNNMSLAADNVQLSQIATATTKKIDGSQDRIKKLEQKSSELDSIINKTKTLISQAKLTRYDSDIKTNQIKFQSNYKPIRDITLNCGDYIEKLMKFQTELEKLKKGKNESINEKQLKEEKLLVSQLSQDHSTLKKRLEGYTKNFQRSVSNITDPNKKEELEQYKNLVRCSVCHDRQKDCVLNTCYHVFCKICLELNLQSRHRKCPGCNIPFDRPNMKPIAL